MSNIQLSNGKIADLSKMIQVTQKQFEQYKKIFHDYKNGHYTIPKLTHFISFTDTNVSLRLFIDFIIDQTNAPENNFYINADYELYVYFHDISVLCDHTESIESLDTLNKFLLKIDAKCVICNKPAMIIELEDLEYPECSSCIIQEYESKEE
ncbi:MAG: hypothetical protein AB1782_10770 [Cyanobacteriota bacterium]